MHLAIEYDISAGVVQVHKMIQRPSCTQYLTAWGTACGTKNLWHYYLSMTWWTCTLHMQVS